MKITIFYLCFFTFLFTFSPQVFAADFTVNVTTDEHDADTLDAVCDTNLTTPGEQCTLRAAIEQSHILVSNDRVFFNLPANSTVTLTTANGGEILIQNRGTLEIIGTGANTLTIDGGAGTNRIFYTMQATVTISGVTLTGGNGGGTTNGNGGAIYANGGSLRFSSVHVTGNTASATGGGVVFGLGVHQINNSTFSANTANNGGGFYNASNMLTIINSTISSNTGNEFAGGFYNSVGTTILRNVTITNNIAPVGGGILQSAGTLDFANTIVAGNTATVSNRHEISYEGGGINTLGGNLIGDSLGDSTNTFSYFAYHPTDIRDVNPLLGTLANNGGTTPTHSLGTGSPAIDAGLNELTTEIFDQRGQVFQRVWDGNGDYTAIVDIGAFEVQITPPVAVTIGGRITAASGRGINRVRVTITDSNGETRTVYSNPFGYYRFTGILTGAIYTFSLSHKYHQFIQNRQVPVITEWNDINFTANN